MKTAERYTCVLGAQRLKSCQIASNYEPVDAYARGKSFRFIRLPPLSREKAPTEIFSISHPLSLRKPPNTISNFYPCPSLAPSRSHPWRIFRGNANSGSPTSSLKLAIYRIDDVEGKWMYVCGKIEATLRIYHERIFPYPPRCPRVISMTTRSRSWETR